MQARTGARAAFMRYTVRTLYVAALMACTIVALTPSILFFPQQASDDYRIALVAAIIVFLFYRAYARPDPRIRILAWVVAGAGVTIASAVVLKLLPAEAWIRFPTTDILPRLLNADGELADDTHFYEVFNEVWLVLAAIVVAVRLVSVKLSNAGSFGRS